MTGAHAVMESAQAARAGARAAVPGALTAVARSWRDNRDVIGNAGALIATTGVASVLGFVFWALAARMFTAEAVGYGSAAVSAMTLLGTIGMLGLGTVLIAELPRRRRSRAGLVSAALVVSAAGSLLLGLGFVLLAPHLSERFADMTGNVVDAAVFAAGVALTGATLVFDQATVGLLRGGLQLTRNTAFAAVKLAILPAAMVVAHSQFGAGITASWVAGLALSVLAVAAWLRLRGEPVAPRPDWGVLRGLTGTAVMHNWLNLAIAVPRLLIPVLVTVVVSPVANAAFYAAWTVSGFLYIIPTHLATVLFAVAAGDAAAMRGKLRLTLRLSALAGLPGMLVLALGARLILGMFGASYVAAATLPLLLFVVGYLPTVPKVHYIAVCRATGQIGRAAVVLSAAAALEVAAAVVGGLVGGLPGLSVALLGVFVLEGLVTAPGVYRIATGRAAGGRRVGPGKGGAG